MLVIGRIYGAKYNEKEKHISITYDCFLYCEYIIYDVWGNVSDEYFKKGDKGVRLNENGKKALHDYITKYLKRKIADIDDIKYLELTKEYYYLDLKDRKINEDIKFNNDVEVFLQKPFQLKKEYIKG